MRQADCGARNTTFVRFVVMSKLERAEALDEVSFNLCNRVEEESPGKPLCWCDMKYVNELDRVGNPCSCDHSGCFRAPNLFCLEKGTCFEHGTLLDSFSERLCYGNADSASLADDSSCTNAATVNTLLTTDVCCMCKDRYGSKTHDCRGYTC